MKTLSSGKRQPGNISGEMKSEHIHLSVLTVITSPAPAAITENYERIYIGFDVETTLERAKRLDFTDPYYKTDIIAIAFKKDICIARKMFDNGEITIGTQHGGITSVDKLQRDLRLGIVRRTGIRGKNRAVLCMKSRVRGLTQI